MRPLTYYVAVSLDGYIAGPDHQIDAFDFSPALAAHIVERYPETLPTPARAQLGIADVANQRFDAVIMGRHTYELGVRAGLTSPYGHLEQVVASRTLSATDPAVRVVDDPLAAVDALKAGGGLGVWLCGGGSLAAALADRIDVLILKRQPLVLGAGRPLFAGAYAPRRFELTGREAAGAATIETYRRAPLSP
ncbi:MAG: dihydrofolate reductase family protein [Nannocystaceae bacterium]